MSIIIKNDEHHKQIIVYLGPYYKKPNVKIFFKRMKW